MHVYKKMIPLIMTGVFLFPSMPVMADVDEVIVETASIESSGEDESIISLASSTREVDDDTLMQWAKDSGILTDDWKTESEKPCDWMSFLRMLWLSNGAPISVSSITLSTEEEKSQENVLKWVGKIGLIEEEKAKKNLEKQVPKKEVYKALWYMSGRPNPDSSTHSLTNGENYEMWACDIGLITKEEQTTYSPSDSITYKDALESLYYYYNRRSENSFPITIEQFLNSCQHVVDYAREHGYIYGSSSAYDPTTDGIISCDRLVAKALYDLGYTEQPRGGITVHNADSYLNSWGFERSTTLAAAKKGSIILVRHKGKDHTSHMYVCASDFNMSTMTGDRYDCGSNGFIRSQQPLRNLGFWYDAENVIVYNIPE